MVFRRSDKKTLDSSSGSDISSDSTEDDLEYLIDDLLEKLVVCSPGSHRMTIKNKNRKERAKHERQDRSNEVEAASTSADDAYNFGLSRFSYPTSEDRNLAAGRCHGRTPWVHTSAASGTLPLESFPYSAYSQSDPSRLLQSTNYIQPTLKRHWPPSLDPSKKNCEMLNEEQLDSDDATGNNSEDEYHRIPEKNAQTSSKIEDNGLEQLLKEKKGWKVIHVRGDGACLFRSVSHQVFGDEEKHAIIRNQVVDYMVKNREHFSQYVTEDFDRYLQRKRHPTCHGNHLEIQAISELYNRPVEIYYNSVVPINVFHAEYSREIPIRLGYYGRTHYNSIIDPCKPSFGQGLGMPNYQPGLPEKDLVNQALHESESSELEEAMLRDKMAESETKELDDCIADAVLRESYYEHLKVCYDMPVKASQQPISPSATSTASTSGSRKVSSPPKQRTKPVTTGSAVAAVASTSSRSQACSSSAAAAAASSSSSSSCQLPTASADPDNLSDFAVLQYIPENMLDMNEEDVLAMVLEQSRSDYINSLRPAKSKDTATAQSYFRQHLNDTPPSSSASILESFSSTTTTTSPEKKSLENKPKPNI